MWPPSDVRQLLTSYILQHLPNKPALIVSWTVLIAFPFWKLPKTPRRSHLSSLTKHADDITEPAPRLSTATLEKSLKCRGFNYTSVNKNTCLLEWKFPQSMMLASLCFLSSPENIDKSLAEESTCTHPTQPISGPSGSFDKEALILYVLLGISLVAHQQRNRQRKCDYISI